jgi:hypothetical protein
MTEPATLAIARCEHCHGRFLPQPGPCPRCGSTDLVPGEIPASALVLAATELQAPAAGWPSPHRLAIVEGAESVRILAVVPGPLPPLGSVVRVRRSGDLYEILSDTAPTSVAVPTRTAPVEPPAAAPTAVPEVRGKRSRRTPG